MASYHLECSSGLAGDMFLGACLDLGMPLAVVADAVARLGLSGVTVEARKARRGGFAGTRFRVLFAGSPLEGPDPHEAGGDRPAHAHPVGHDHGHPHSHGHEHGHPHPGEHGHGHPHPGGLGAVASTQGGGPEPAQPLHPGHPPSGHRGLAEIRELIGASSLAPAVAARALRLFQRLGEAEAKVHGMALDEVHFHEVGAIDSIVDLVGAAAAIEHLAPERLTCGPVNVGSGRVRTAHGDLPVPAPATAELLRGAPIYGGPGGELTTPTGAVLLAELVDAFVDLPPLVLEAAGFGLGRKEVATQPNGARLLRGQGVAARAEAVSEDAPGIMVVECEVDNLPGEGFGFLMESLFAAGALDVYFTSVQMKKNRPGTLVTVLCRRERLATLAGALLVESGSLGCRYHMAARFEAEREVVEVETAFGTVRVKRARLDGKPLAAAPEFEDCRRLALSLGVPWREVYRAALAAAPGT